MIYNRQKNPEGTKNTISVIGHEIKGIKCIMMRCHGVILLILSFLLCIKVMY